MEKRRIKNILMCGFVIGVIRGTVRYGLLLKQHGNIVFSKEKRS